MKRLTKWLIGIDILVAICFFVVYCPIFKNLQNTIISTAIDTKTHDYIAYTFYSEARVQEVINADKFQPINEEINLDEIVIDTKPRDSYDNEFDEAILTRDPGNEHFKYLKIKVGKYDAHLVAIYDPSEVRILTSKKFNTTTDARYGGGQEKMINMTKRLGATVGINGGGFVDYGYGSDIPLGYVIKDGKVIWNKKGGGKGNLIGFTNDNKLPQIKSVALFIINFNKGTYYFWIYKSCSVRTHELN